MSKVGVMMSEDRADGTMSSHFGKAEWVMIADTENSIQEFEKNDSQTCTSAVEIALRHGCKNLIFTEIGHGAIGHLTAAGIRGWVAPKLITGEQALQMFTQSQLQAVNEITEHGAGHGCCCANTDHAEAPSCCRG
jgi:predicted Fe-Mo cluster-binding NifX family protein